MFEKILVPLDGSELAECVIPFVEELAKKHDAKEVVLFRVCDAPSILADYPGGMPSPWEKHVEQITGHVQKQCRIYLDDTEERLKKEGINVKTDSALGNPADDIVDYADKNGFDLIVMASHGRSGVSRWAFGSVADKVFRSTCVPVLMIRAPGCFPELA
jgi:nucleotide-binding universal stress UspA family protein